MYELLDAQKEFLEIPHKFSLDVAVYQGGFGSGKTFAGSLLGILLCLKYPKIKGLVGAATFPIVRDTTLATYFEHLENLNFKQGIHYNFYKSESKLLFKNGSSILFKHFENPNKLKSLNLGFVQIEEMSDVPHSTFSMLLGRMRQTILPEWKNFVYRIFGHTNPEPNKGWIYNTFVEAPKPNYRLIIAPTTQNTHLPKNFVEELKKAYDPDYYKINVLGQCGDYSSGLVVKNFNNQNVLPINYNANLPLYLTCDFNVDPMAWILAHVVENKVFYFDEIVIENTSTLACIEEFYSRYSNHRAKIIINGDASGNNRSTTSEFTNYVLMKNRLSALGFKNVDIKIRPFNPPIKNRIAAFNTKICDCDGNRSIFIDPKCEKLLYNCRNLKYKVGSSIVDVPTSSQIRTNNELKFLEHPFDAASYLVEYYFPIVLSR